MARSSSGKPATVTAARPPWWPKWTPEFEAEITAPGTFYTDALVNPAVTRHHHKHHVHQGNPTTGDALCGLRNLEHPSDPRTLDLYAGVCRKCLAKSHGGATRRDRAVLGDLTGRGPVTPRAPWGHS